MTTAIWLLRSDLPKRTIKLVLILVRALLHDRAYLTMAEARKVRKKTLPAPWFLGSSGALDPRSVGPWSRMTVGSQETQASPLGASGQQCGNC